MTRPNWCHGHNKPHEANGYCRICNQEMAESKAERSRKVDTKDFMVNYKWQAGAISVSLTVTADNEKQLLERAASIYKKVTDKHKEIGQPERKDRPSKPWCSQHNVELTEFTKGDSHWWSHKDGAKWCKGDQDTWKSRQEAA